MQNQVLHIKKNEQDTLNNTLKKTKGSIKQPWG